MSIFCKNRSLSASCIDLICKIVIFILYTAVLKYFCLVTLKQVVMYCKMFGESTLQYEETWILGFT